MNKYAFGTAAILLSANLLADSFQNDIAYSYQSISPESSYYPERKRHQLSYTRYLQPINSSTFPYDLAARMQRTGNLNGSLGRETEDSEYLGSDVKMGGSTYVFNQNLKISSALKRRTDKEFRSIGPGSDSTVHKNIGGTLNSLSLQLEYFFAQNTSFDFGYSNTLRKHSYQWADLTAGPSPLETRSFYIRTKSASVAIRHLQSFGHESLLDLKAERGRFQQNAQIGSPEMIVVVNEVSATFYPKQHFSLGGAIKKSGDLSRYSLQLQYYLSHSFSLSALYSRLRRGDESHDDQLAYEAMLNKEMSSPAIGAISRLLGLDAAYRF